VKEGKKEAKEAEKRRGRRKRLKNGNLSFKERMRYQLSKLSLKPSRISMTRSKRIFETC